MTEWGRSRTASRTNPSSGTWSDGFIFVYIYGKGAEFLLVTLIAIYGNIVDMACLLRKSALSSEMQEK
jgi:hypothetical protein